MKRLVLWALGLFALAGFGLVWGYSQRNFAGMLAGVALGMSALAVLIKPVRTLLTVLVSMAVALTLAEVVLGFTAVIAPPQGIYDPASDYVRHYWNHTDIGGVPRPGKHGTRKLTPDGEVIYEASYSIGDDGFRVTPGNPASSRQRVNFLGCSHTFGEGLNDDQTLPAQVQKLLPDVTVRNFGVHGYGMHQALAILQSQRDTAGQVNFAITVPWHAERSACLPSFALGSPRYALQKDGTLVRNGVCGGISYYPLARILSLSKVYGLVKLAIQSAEKQDAQIDLYLAIIREMAKLSQSRQQILKIGFFGAAPNWFTGSYTNEKVVSAMKDMGVEVIDISLADKPEYRGLKLTLHALDEHATALANSLTAPRVADAVAAAMRKAEGSKP